MSLCCISMSLHMMLGMWMWRDVECVPVSCGYGTCFAVKTCGGLYHFSEIGHINLSIEAQCVTTLLPLGDWHMTYDLACQTHPRHCQGQPLLKILRPYIKRFSQESADSHTDGMILYPQALTREGIKKNLGLQMERSVRNAKY